MVTTEETHSKNSCLSKCKKYTPVDLKRTISRIICICDVAQYLKNVDWFNTLVQSTNISKRKKKKMTEMKPISFSEPLISPYH